MRRRSFYALTLRPRQRFHPSFITTRKGCRSDAILRYSQSESRGLIFHRQTTCPRPSYSRSSEQESSGAFQFGTRSMRFLKGRVGTLATSSFRNSDGEVTPRRSSDYRSRSPARNWEPVAFL